MKPEFRSKKDRGNRQEGAGVGGRGEGWRDDWVVTKQGLAALLTVSLKTVERMLKNGDITRMKGLPSDVVRFYLPDVMKELRRGKNKFGREAATETTGAGGNLGQGIEQEGTEDGPRNRQSPIANSQGHLTQPSPQRGEGAAWRHSEGGAS